MPAVPRRRCSPSFGFIGRSDAEDGKAESLRHRHIVSVAGALLMFARSGYDNDPE